jgi:hypothetical protein
MKDEQTSPQLQSRFYRLAAVDSDFFDLLGFADDAEGVWAQSRARGLKPHSSIEPAPEQDTPEDTAGATTQCSFA